MSMLFLIFSFLKLCFWLLVCFVIFNSKVIIIEVIAIVVVFCIGELLKFGIKILIVKLKNIIGIVFNFILIVIFKFGE